MRINTTGWLKYISIVICINGASFASELSSDLKSATDDITLSNCQNIITHLNSFDDVLNEDSELIEKLDNISIHLFSPITFYIDKNDLKKLQNNRNQLQSLVWDKKLEIELQSVSWAEFHANFILSQKIIDKFLDDAKIQEKITNPPYADKLKTLLNSDISTISLSNFCNHIIEFDYVLQKIFFTKPHVDGEPSCAKCGEQTVGMTMCYSQSVLECHFCGHEQFL